MASNNGPEQKMDAEAGTTGTTGTDSTAYQSDGEKTEQAIAAQGAVGEPDSDHEEVEMMDPGHLVDLERQKVHFSHSSIPMSSLTFSDPRIYQSRSPKISRRP